MFFGITRYSLFSPGSGSWKTTRSGVFKTEDEYMSYLFSDARMNIRQHMFLDRSVPVLASMAKRHDYRHFVLYSDVLPAQHKEFLLAACAKHPFLIPLEWSKPVSGSGITEVRPAMEEFLRSRYSSGDGLQPVAWFRLDDDDVLAADYLDRLEPYRRLDFVDKAVSFGLGLTAYKTNNDLVNLREYYYPKSAQGMAFITLYNSAQGSLCAPAPGPHPSVDRVMPTMVDSRNHMFFQMRHADQDSTLNETVHERIAESLARLEKLPPLEAGQLSPERWPTLAPVLAAGEKAGTRQTLSADEGVGPFKLKRDAPARFDVQAASGFVELEFTYSSPQRVVGQFVAVSYNMNGPEETDWAAYGLRKSSERGLFRTAAGRGSTGVVRQTLLVPEGAAVNGIEMRAIGSHTSPITITVTSLRQLDLALTD